ncbi:MAG TPA: TetR/AcrR family transcriptional regulator [Gaiellaceae bacterium]|jgi:AcrR family transcriptional regulator|nr:TetR/AcrR family transcriptional regulator [Gaiellaceae bacterium]
MAVTERKSAEERREQILEAALAEFAARGLEGGSTEAIAKAVGISQPYVFRLFGTKKELFIASVERCMRGTLEMFRTASAGLNGDEALHAIGEAYVERLGTDPTYLHAQMQAYAACDDPQIRDVVRRGYGELVEYVERASGQPAERVSHFFAKGMLLNVMASMDLLGADEGWAQRLIEGCRQDV